MHIFIRNCLKVFLVIFLITQIALVGQMAVAGNLDNPPYLFLFIRYCVYTLTWISILVFFYNLMFEDTDIVYKDQIKNMKIASFWAFILCAIKFGLNTAYLINVSSPSKLFAANAIAELAVWFLLTIFFFAFWRWKKKMDDEIEIDGEEDVF